MNHPIDTQSSFENASVHADNSSSRYQGSDLAASLLRRLFQHYPDGLMLRLWTGESVRVGCNPDSAASSGFSLVFKNPEAVCTAVLGRDPLRLAESYFRGDIDIEGDFFAALSVKDHLDAIGLSGGAKLQALFSALQLRRMNRERQRLAASTVRHGHRVKAHSKYENRDAIHFHYDLSNEFYALWLDQRMVYSCAYFENPEVDVDRAQVAKLDHICKKLLLQPGEQFLDVGCGWGALVIHAARHYGVRARGITLSERQLEFARRRIAAEGLSDRVSVDLIDYRDMPNEPKYDKIASVGMFEHVGLKNLPIYFSTVHRLLKPHGLFLNHGITHEAEGWGNTLSTQFINRYVFPDGQLDTISHVESVMERAQFEIADVEALRPHYALTLRQWVARLEKQRARALELVSQATYRVWRLYMAASALQFEAGDIGLYQILAAKRGSGPLDIPLTRRHLYR
ncbi:MAG TPA: cyclopropane-fatty-acyl-phospholipid synthase family protein [Steroidobacteraceae bacterium]|jgi:cyclopropane-fatty-acyl-phospholipid synthase